MAHPVEHARSSAKKFGGKPEDHLAIHRWFNESKALFPDFRPTATRLAREDSFCHDLMTKVETAWLRQHRGGAARHWNLLTDIGSKHLAYAG